MTGFGDQDRATIRFMAGSWGWSPARIADVYDVAAGDIRRVLEEEDTREDRPGTAREAPSSEGVQPAGPQQEGAAGSDDASDGEHAGEAAPDESRAKAEASAPAPDASGEDPERRGAAGHSASRPSRGGGTPASLSPPSRRPTAVARKPRAPLPGRDAQEEWLRRRGGPTTLENSPLMQAVAFLRGRGFPVQKLGGAGPGKGWFGVPDREGKTAPLAGPKARKTDDKGLIAAARAQGWRPEGRAAKAGKATKGGGA